VMDDRTLEEIKQAENAPIPDIADVGEDLYSIKNFSI